jgi:hypothetical protein
MENVRYKTKVKKNIRLQIKILKIAVKGIEST